VTDAGWVAARVGETAGGSPVERRRALRKTPRLDARRGEARVRRAYTQAPPEVVPDALVYLAGLAGDARPADGRA